MMAPPTPGDASARAAALDVRASIILQAPAGSGKTTILVQRFLALLAEVDAPEAVLAMTFTRKAAAEMRARVLGALASATGPSPAADGADRVTWTLACAVRERDAALGWDLETHPARLRILTIDGLNRALASAMPVSARGTTGLELVENAEALYREVARRTLQDAETDPSIAPESGRVFDLLDNRWDRLEEMLAAMLGRRAEWLRHILGRTPQALRGTIEATLRGMVEGLLADACRSIPPGLRDEGVSLAEFAAGNLAARDPGGDLAAALRPIVEAGGRDAPTPAAGVEDLARWRGLAALALTKGSGNTPPKLRAAVNVATGFPPGSDARKADMSAWLSQLARRPGAVEALLRLQAAPQTTLEDADASTLAALAALLTYAAQQLLVRFREVGQVDHVEIAAAANLVVRSGFDDLPPETGPAAWHQGVPLEHILIDEFQDTSYPQFALLEALVRDWTAEDGRTLFVVGDPMQSIYQFREAEVGLFLRARDDGVAGLRLRPLELTANFRSQRAIVDEVNAVFPTVFPAAPSAREAAVPYLPFETATTRTPRLAAEVVLHAQVAGTDATADAVREAGAVRDAIRAAQGRDPSASIAVLVSARSHALHIARALRQAGIAVQGVDLVPLGDTPVVQDLVSLTRALLSQTDRIAWLALLRAPFCGLSLADLTRLVEGARRVTVPELLAGPRIAALSEDGRRRIARVWPALDAALLDVRRTLAVRVESLWLQLGGPAAYVDPAALDDARRYLDLLAVETMRRPALDVGTLDRLLSGLFAGSDSIAQGAVQIMTIHRSKGLEFDVVLLPGLARKARNDESSLLDWVAWQSSGRDSLLLAPYAPPRQGGEREPPGSLRAQVRALRRARLSRERARLLYVAMTRARTALHLFATLGVDPGNGLIRAPTAQTPLGVLWPALGPRFTAKAQQVAPQTPGAAPSIERTADGAAPPSPPPIPESAGGPWRLPAEGVTTPWPQDIAVERLELPSAELSDTPQIVWAGDAARVAGTVVHRELERLARAVDLPTSAWVAGEAGRLRAVLQAEGVSAADLDAALSRVVRALEATLGDERGRWMLARHAAFDAVELPLTGLFEGRIVNVVIDRCFVDGGVRWVVDYKTSLHDGGDAETFVAERCEAYRPQITRYAAFARRLGPEPVRAALYFPLLGRFEEIAIG